ncbi:MAG: Holliday junction branch migration protein RuvA, partial [Halanaerobiales bacterium]
DEVGKIGDEVKIFTYYHVREDAAILFGFNKMEEKNMFLKLMKVNGVGPKLAMTILSGVSISDLAIAINNSDVAPLNSIKGVGKKTAERILLELKESIDGFEVSNAVNGGVDVKNSSIQDACNTLSALGINKSEAYKIVRSVAESGDTVEQIIEKSLKSFNK